MTRQVDLHDPFLLKKKPKKQQQHQQTLSMMFKCLDFNLSWGMVI